jgi:hypothetical protein
LTHEAGGKLTVVPREEWFRDGARPGIAEGAGARTPRRDPPDRPILPTTAFVKVKCAIPPRFFVDYLSFLKTDGRWRVAQKVFSVRTEEAAARS